MAENTSRRTTISKWVYRICLSLMILGTVRAFQFMQDQLPLLKGSAEGPTLWIVQFTVLSDAIMLAICCLAILLRSGAVVWLLGALFLFTATPLVLGAWPDPANFAIAAVLVASTLAISAVVFTFLIVKQELRTP